MDSLELVGYLAGALVAVALTPQLVKTFKTKSTSDISISWTLILMSGLALWIVYGTLNRILPLAIFACIEFCMVFTLFAMKMRYK